ncbi:MAG: SLC45 family MFS transporter [Armatimonadaceae bacterium]
MNRTSLVSVSAGLFGVSLVWQIYNAYIPLFLQAGRPDFAQGAGIKGFALNPTATGFVMTLDNLAALLILPFIGILSDRIGRRKPFIAIGAPLAALGMILTPLSVSALPLFLLALALVIVAMDTFRTPLTALLADLAPPEQRSKGNGMIMFGYGLGSVTAFILGGKLFALSPAAPFFLAAGGMLLAGLAVTAFVREPERHTVAEQRPPVWMMLKTLTPVVKSLLAAVFMWTLGVSALAIFFTSFAVKAFSLDGGQAMMLMGFFGIAGVVGALPAGMLGTRFGRPAMIRTGLALLIVLLPIVSTLNSLEMLRVMLVLMGLSWSLVQVNALPLLLDYTLEDRAGEFTGMFLLADQSASIVGPILSGWIIGSFSTDYRALFLYTPTMMAGALLLLFTGKVSPSVSVPFFQGTIASPVPGAGSPPKPNPPQ